MVLEALRRGVVAALAALSAMTQAASFVPPATPSRPVVDVVHGVTLTDRYRWLEKGDDAEVKAWSRAQHEATLAWLEREAPEVAGLRAELAAYFDRDIAQAPFFKHGREFFMRTRKGEAQAKAYTRVDGKEVLLFDPLVLDPSGKTSVRRLVLNRDASKAAVSTFSRGSEITDFRIVDTLTGAQIGDVLEGVDDFGWARDERYAYIAPRTAESIARQEPQRCYRHRLGGDRRDDELLIAMTDAKDFCSVYEPEDANVTVFETGDFYSNTLKIRPLDSRAQPETIYSSREFRARPLFRKDRIYIVTNDHAPNFKLMAASYDAPGFAHWKLLWPEQETVLDGIEVTREHILVRDRKDVLTRLWVHAHDGERLRELPLPQLGNVTESEYDREADVVYATLSTFDAPGKLFRIDGRRLDWSLVWEDAPPLDTSELEAKLVFYPAADGARVPMFLAYRKGIALDGNRPLFLNGYGGFNIGIAPAYVGSWASFINRGGIYARAGIRGGDEYGERWHEAAKFGRKQTTFDDFAAAAEWLVKERYTSASRLVIGGGSNGGLLIGAMLTQRPDLFKAALCAVPLLDMVRFHKFLIARYWIAEYGDPEKAQDFAWLLRYSPYQNIRAGVNMPTTLVVAGEFDSRVDPLHAKKFVAAAQANVGQVDPVLLYMDFDSGHGYGKSKDQTIRDREYELRFVMHMLGMR